VNNSDGKVVALPDNLVWAPSCSWFCQSETTMFLLRNQW